MDGARWLGPIGIEMRHAEAEFRIESGCTIMRATRIACFGHITLGTGTKIADGCSLVDSDVHDYRPGAFAKDTPAGRIQLGSSVKLAPEVTILKNVSIGDETLVGNKSVVQRSLPGYCIAAGNPARVLLRYGSKESRRHAAPAPRTEEPPRTDVEPLSTS
jgi:acetyltransferase-like isoleucine patch superfamily enzyme